MRPALLQILTLLACILHLCSGAPVGEASSSKAGKAGKSFLAPREGRITKKRTFPTEVVKYTPARVKKILKGAGVHGKLNAKEIHEKVLSVFPVARNGRKGVPHIAKHLSKVGVQSNVIEDFVREKSGQ
jgi:hypothetical protein